jgi:hypothetical protein
LVTRLSILSSLVVGVALVVVPWFPLWETNWLLPRWPLVRALLLSPYARGAVTGLGLVNVVVAMADLYGLLTGPDRRS